MCVDGKPSGDSGRRRPSDFAGVKTLKSRRGFLKIFYGSPGGPALGTSKFFALVNFPRDSEVREDREGRRGWHGSARPHTFRTTHSYHFHSPMPCHIFSMIFRIVPAHLGIRKKF